MVEVGVPVATNSESLLDKAIEVIIKKSGYCPYPCVIDARSFIENRESNFEGFREASKIILDAHKPAVDNNGFNFEFKELPQDSARLRGWAIVAGSQMQSEYKNFVALNDVLNIPQLDEETSDSIVNESILTLGRFYGYMALQKECLKSVSRG